MTLMDKDGDFELDFGESKAWFSLEEATCTGCLSRGLQFVRIQSDDPWESADLCMACWDKLVSLVAAHRSVAVTPGGD